MRWKDGAEKPEKEGTKGQSVCPLLSLCNRLSLFPSAPWPIHHTHTYIVSRLLHRLNKSCKEDINEHVLCRCTAETL